MASKWDNLAPIYDIVIRKDRKAYLRMYEQIRADIAGKEVLELATGTGLIAIHTADAAKSYVATDFSEKMILQAKKKKRSSHCRFEVADATDLPYGEGCFDVVLISNALHILPNSEKALQEIARVLRADGMLIAANFLWEEAGIVAKLIGKIMKKAGVRPSRRFSESTYREFLQDNGWQVLWTTVWKATFPLMYARCVKKVAPAD